MVKCLVVCYLDLRLDWQTYNVIPNDDKFLDLAVSFGAAFPLKDDSGKEILEARRFKNFGSIIFCWLMKCLLTSQTLSMGVIDTFNRYTVA